MDYILPKPKKTLAVNVYNVYPGQGRRVQYIK